MGTSARISFGLIDVTAKDDSIPSITDKQDFVNIEDLKRDDLVEIKYGTCEKNQFALDGTFELMPDELEDMGLWTNSMSDEDGNFDVPPVLNIDFTMPHSSMGLTFIFSKAHDYPGKMNIKYYDALNNLLSDTDFEPDDYYYVANNIVEDYQRIVITFYSTNNPFRYIKLYKILYGANKIFAGESLIEASMLEELDLLSSELSVNVLDFKVYSENDEFNIINPQGIFTMLQSRQKLEVTGIQDDQEKNMGTYYLDKWDKPQKKTMKMSATDLLGVIDKTNFMGNIYFNVPIENIVQEIMESAGLTTDEYTIANNLIGTLMSGHIPICSHREALQQLLFAIGVVADCSRSDKINIYTPSQSLSRTIDQVEDIFTGTFNVKKTDMVTSVKVLSHNYIQGTVVETLFEGELEAGDNEILFNEPVSNLTITGGTIVRSNCNYAIVNRSTSGNVVIQGRKFIINRLRHSASVALSAQQKAMELSIEDAYFINNRTTATQVAQRVLDYYQRTFKTSFDYILQSEELGDYTEINAEYDQTLLGNITKLNIDLLGGWVTSAEVHSSLKEE